MTKAEFADAIGCNRNTYAAIENGVREGKMSLWMTLQGAFNVPNELLTELMKRDEEA